MMFSFVTIWTNRTHCKESHWNTVARFVQYQSQVFLFFIIFHVMFCHWRHRQHCCCWHCWHCHTTYIYINSLSSLFGPIFFDWHTYVPIITELWLQLAIHVSIPFPIHTCSMPILMCCCSKDPNDFRFRFNCYRRSKLDEQTVYLPKTVYFCGNFWWYQWTEIRRPNTININNTTRIRYHCRWPRRIQHQIDNSQHKHRLTT